MTNKLSFEANRQSEDDLRKIGKHELTFNFYASRMLDKVPADIINCDDLAIQFDCYLENEQDNQWLTGAIKWNFRLAGSSDHEITFTPWHPNYNDAYKEVDRSFSEGWKTLTFPLKDFKHVGGETVADIKARILTLEGNNNRGFFMFAFAEFDYPTGSGNNRSRGEAVTNQLFYFGNFRIVPYTKPVE